MSRFLPARQNHSTNQLWWPHLFDKSGDRGDTRKGQVNEPLMETASLYPDSSNTHVMPVSNHTSSHTTSTTLIIEVIALVVQLLIYDVHFHTTCKLCSGGTKTCSACAKLVQNESGANTWHCFFSKKHLQFLFYTCNPSTT
jgi:hypothetical protein